MYMHSTYICTWRKEAPVVDLAANIVSPACGVISTMAKESHTQLCSNRDTNHAERLTLFNLPKIDRLTKNNGPHIAKSCGTMTFSPKTFQGTDMGQKTDWLSLISTVIAYLFENKSVGQNYNNSSHSHVTTFVS